MSEVTLGELMERRKALETSAASLLGHMLFEFSRLDTNLGLCLVWVDGGARLNELTKSVEPMNLKTKLDALTERVHAKLPIDSKRRLAYDNWIKRAHTIRQVRNSLVHGRWGVEAQRNKVVNVVGLPTSENQIVTEYSLDELSAINRELHSLSVELNPLRENWPL